MHACNLSIQEKEAGEPCLLGHPRLYSNFKFKDDLGYRRPCVKEEEVEQEEAADVAKSHSCGPSLHPTVPELRALVSLLYSTHHMLLPGQLISGHWQRS